MGEDCAFAQSDALECVPPAQAGRRRYSGYLTKIQYPFPRFRPSGETWTICFPSCPQAVVSPNDGLPFVGPTRFQPFRNTIESPSSPFSFKVQVVGAYIQKPCPGRKLSNCLKRPSTHPQQTPDVFSKATLSSSGKNGNEQSCQPLESFSDSFVISTSIVYILVILFPMAFPFTKACADMVVVFVNGMGLA